ncbi:hypothetical protein ZEAMMB73_Zm00001d015944 [Zea mays]|uniref:Uncharacterized protein n=1 Tax=Zea mays TaxID=4577 RepID=A0A1D6H4M9_MAIZE|nr:hypothetical protein ZEAMMB73_Zm00001d015944 [Zea mays]
MVSGLCRGDPHRARDCEDQGSLGFALCALSLIFFMGQSMGCMDLCRATTWSSPTLPFALAMNLSLIPSWIKIVIDVNVISGALRRLRIDICQKICFFFTSEEIAWFNEVLTYDPWARNQGTLMFKRVVSSS